MSLGDETQPPYERSPTPIITDEELRNHVVRCSRDVSDIKVALIGNKYQTGLIPRVDKIETIQSEHSKKFLVWGSILSAAGTALVFIKDYLHSPKP